MVDKKQIATNQGRRSVLKKAGSVGLLATAGLTGKVSAAQEKGAKNQSWKKVRNEITRAFKEDGTDGVRRVMDNRGEPYDMSSKKIDKEITFDSNDDISTESRYSESNSEFYVLANPVFGYDNRARITVQTALDTVRATIQRKATWIDDAIGFTYDNRNWSVVGTPYLNATDVHQESWNRDPDLTEGGLAGEIDLREDGAMMPDSAIVTLEAVIEHEQGSKSTVWGHYEHTIANTRISSIEIELDLGLFEVNTSWLATTAWDEDEPVDPSIVM